MTDPHNTENTAKKPKKSTQKKPYIPRLSESYFFNSALYYLQRYSSTKANLHQILNRKIFRARQKGADIPAECPAWINQAVEKCVRLGYINDHSYAESKITSMRREGRSTRFIQQNLKQKGVPDAIITQLLQSDKSRNDFEDEDENGNGGSDHDMQAALRTIRRRNLVRAILRHDEGDARKDAYQKNLAKLVRAGFPLQTAKQALDRMLEQSLL